jgi:hypothetical protein
MIALVLRLFSIGCYHFLGEDSESVDASANDEGAELLDGETIVFWF